MKLWIAREKDGSLWLFNVKPEFNGREWIPYTDDLFPHDYCSIYENIFPEVTFENSPQAVELKLIK